MATSLTRVKGEVKAKTIFDLTFDACQKCSKSNFSSRVINIVLHSQELCEILLNSAQFIETVTSTVTSTGRLLLVSYFACKACILACEQALCLGKKIAFSLFPLPTSLDQRPVHRLHVWLTFILFRVIYCYLLSYLINLSFSYPSFFLTLYSYESN